MKKVLLIIAAVAFGPLASAWGDLGHAAIAEIAQKHLTPKAEKAVTEYLGGMRLASVASEADKFRSYWVTDLGFVPSNPDYARLHARDFDRSQPLNIAPWSHSITVDAQMNPYKTDNLDGAYINNDAYYVTKLAAELKRKAPEMDSLERRKAICLIVHFIGDMHCPVHIVYLPDNPGKGSFSVTYKGKKMSYHSYWDGGIFSGMPVGFMELAYLSDTKDKKEIARITEGNVYDWARDCAVSCLEAYEAVKPESVIEETQTYNFRPLLYKQIRNAGYRLAAQLNEIFK